MQDELVTCCSYAAWAPCNGGIAADRAEEMLKAVPQCPVVLLPYNHLADSQRTLQRVYFLKLISYDVIHRFRLNLHGEHHRAYWCDSQQDVAASVVVVTLPLLQIGKLSLSMAYIAERVCQSQAACYTS